MQYASGRGRPGASRVIVSASVLALAAGWAVPASADDDDKKLRDKQPAVRGKIVTPDAWKLASREAPPAGGEDASFTSKNVNMKSWLPLNSFTGEPADSNGADCWGYTSPSGREYALMGLSWGNGIVEVTNPSAPVVIATIPGSVNLLWRDITVIGNYAYAVSDNGGVGIQVINLTNIDSGTVTLVRNYAQGGHSATHTLINNPASGFMYACGGDAAGGRAIPVSVAADPTFPTFTGVSSPTNYVHEALAVNYTSGPYAGQEIVFLFTGTAGLEIVNWTNKNSPVTLFQGSYPGEQYGHQGWITDDKKYLYINDELDTPSAGRVPRFLTRVFDITDLTMPRLVSTISNGLPSVDHNEYVKGRYLYQSNYTSGLRIWDLTNPLKPYEVAWFDSRPENDGTGYNGAWGNYPYFASGTVLISDIERGLFAVKMSILEFDNTRSYPTTVTPGVPTPITAKLTGYDDAVVGAVNLRVSVNGGAYSTIPMNSVGGGEYEGSIPAMSPFARVRYYIEALTTDAPARTFTWPLDAVNGQVFTAYSQSSEQVIFSDNFEGNLGWAVSTIANNGTPTGAWTRAVPLANGGPGAVVGDGDGSGTCFVTSNTVNVEVDFCTTTLTSPAFDLSQAPEARVSYKRWLLSIQGVTDTLTTEISGNNGNTWITVNSIGPVTGGWEDVTFRVADFISPTSQVRLRFVVSDAPRPNSAPPPDWLDDSITEAGIDAVRIVSPVVNEACYANCDGSSGSPILTANDFQCFLNEFAAGNSFANCDGSTGSPALTANDFQCFLNKFAAGCS